MDRKINRGKVSCRTGRWIDDWMSRWVKWRHSRVEEQVGEQVDGWIPGWTVNSQRAGRMDRQVGKMGWQAHGRVEEWTTAPVGKMLTHPSASASVLPASQPLANCSSL